jgi:transposase
MGVADQNPAMSAVASKAEVKSGYWHLPRWPLRVDGSPRHVIQASKPEPRIMRYELTDYEWAAIKLMLPNKPRGVSRVNDRRVLNNIFWVLRSGCAVARSAGELWPVHTCYNRFVRWRRAGVWDQLMNALTVGHDAAVQMIDTSIVRVHQHGACIAENIVQNIQIPSMYPGTSWRAAT